MGIMEVLLDTIQNMWKTFSMIGIADIVDILLVAVILYYVFMAVRNTNAKTSLIGILLLLVIMGVASLLQLNTLSWLLSNVMQIGLLALVIIFQPELRKMLEQLGRRTFPKIFTHHVAEYQMDTVINETISACRDLSETRTGALIIFERDTLLQEEINSGTILDAGYNAELLKNIFYEGAPLHDGAVIVRNGRIISAGCMLPLTDNQNLSKDLGMRHRAGIGMSERSDAVCVIVSEETGAISVAMEGIIRRSLTLDTLLIILKRELISDDPMNNEKGISNLKKKLKGDKK